MPRKIPHKYHTISEWVYEQFVKFINEDNFGTYCAVIVCPCPYPYKFRDLLKVKFKHSRLSEQIDYDDPSVIKKYTWGKPFTLVTCNILRYNHVNGNFIYVDLLPVNAFDNVVKMNYLVEGSNYVNFKAIFLYIWGHTVERRTNRSIH